jgi:predicted ester cyclase
MPTVNELTAKFIAVLDAKDLDGLRKLGLGNVRFVTADFYGSAGRDFVGYLGKWTTGFPDYRLEAGPIIGEGKSTAYSWVFRGTNTGPLKTDAGDLPATGKSVEVPVLGTAAWDGEQMTDMLVLWDQLLMLRQLGLA